MSRINLQNWINGQGNAAAEQLIEVITGLGWDANALLDAVSQHQVNKEADELKERLIELAMRGLDLGAAVKAVESLTIDPVDSE